MYRTDIELDRMILDRQQTIQVIRHTQPVTRTTVRRPGRLRRALGQRVVSIGLALVG